MPTALQFAGLLALTVAVWALTDWRWALLLVGIVAFTTGYLLERGGDVRTPDQ